MEAVDIAAESEIWRWLGEVPDPEIPAISIVDLGIVRSVRWVQERGSPRLVVTITPTYSGCPATEVIFEEVRRALESHGIHDPKLVKQLAPAWTTDWLTPDALDRLRGYGIAPPVEQIIDASRIGFQSIPLRAIRCPRCDSSNTELISEFGSTPCKALYRCRDCREPFDYFKRH